MAISDLFSSSFLFSITLILILFGAGFLYFSYKMAEQDHKLTSMVNLVSILAQDLHFVKSNVSITGVNNHNDNDMLDQMIGGNQIPETTGSSDIISVSDGDDEDEDEEYDEDDDDENTDEDDEDTDEDDENDFDDDDGDEQEYDINEENVKQKNGQQEDEDVLQKQIKLINLTLENDIVEDIDSHFEEIDNNSQKEEIKTIHLETLITSEETNNQLQIPSDSNVIISSEDISFLKNVSITDSGDTDELHDSKSDYKKMSLNKLREVVVSKGFVTDSSKLKKNDILKILGEE